MKTLLLICCIFLLSCANKVLVTENCPSVACTQEFRSVSIKFKDAAGQAIAVNNFSAIIKRTGKSTVPYPTDTSYFKGSYSVATDMDTKTLLAKGDIIDVSAVNPKTSQKKTAQFVVSGGKCACHIEKISGPEDVVFD